MPSQPALKQKFTFILCLTLLLSVTLAACAATGQSAFKELGPDLVYEVLNSYAHDPEAFTQGLVWEGDGFIESTGLYGQSSLRRLSLTGEILQNQALEGQYFGEGIALLNGKIYQLTWREGVGFIYDAQSLEKLGQFTYPGQGWGLTTDGQFLILSDGSNRLYFYQPEGFVLDHSIEVQHKGLPVERLNELEWVQGSIFANLWMRDIIVRVDPQSGEVLSEINLEGLRPPQALQNPEAVLNGIAYDPARDKLYVTGKNWDQLFEIRLLPLKP